jgi:CopG family nickel-responsive transcriptional regulator
MSIISLSIPKNLLEKVDSYVKEQGFANRSEIVRQALRAYLSEGRKLGELQGKLTVTITIIYKSEAKTGQIADIQHEYSNIIATFLHTHVDQGH